MNNHLKTYQETRIILDHERYLDAAMDIYPPNHLLVYIRRGQLVVSQHGNPTIYLAGEIVMLKKFTPFHIQKICDPDEEKFSSLVFSFHEDLVQEALLHLAHEIVGESSAEPGVFSIQPNALLLHFIDSLKLICAEEWEVDQNLARLKTYEALVGILKTNPDLLSAFRDFAQPHQADLFAYMNRHFLEKKKLAEFARESGRSLSTFKKDFQQVFGSSPAQWLKRKRLHHAHQLLRTTNRKPSEIYLACGFEDLAHFSRSFKQQFGINPSEMRENGVSVMI